MPEIVIFSVSLIAAIRGADWIGKASITVAKRLGVSHFVIGATLVALATTLPELTIAFISGNVNSDPLFGLGNVLGSPIMNLGLILGTFFILTKHQPSLGYYSRSVNVLLIVSLLLFFVSLAYPIGEILSIILILFGFLFLFLEFTLSQNSTPFIDQIENRFEKFISFFHLAGSKDVIFEFIFGVGLLFFGCKFLVDSGISIANNIGVDDFFISATILALGTSLPELVTMLTSVAKKRNGLSIGNLVGASVINLTIGVGLATLTVKTVIAPPFNFLFFGAILALGVVCLLALWKQFSIVLIGYLLVSISVIFLLTISLVEFLPQL